MGRGALLASPAKGRSRNLLSSLVEWPGLQRCCVRVRLQGGSAFLRPLTSPSPALECLGLKASHFPKGAFMRLSPQPWWLQEPRG